jgi:hypothetical protein
LDCFIDDDEDAEEDVIVGCGLIRKSTGVAVVVVRA